MEACEQQLWRCQILRLASGPCCFWHLPWRYKHQITPQLISSSSQLSNRLQLAKCLAYCPESRIALCHNLLLNSFKSHISHKGACSLDVIRSACYFFFLFASAHFVNILRSFQEGCSLLKLLNLEHVEENLKRYL